MIFFKKNNVLFTTNECSVPSISPPYNNFKKLSFPESKALRVYCCQNGLSDVTDGIFLSLILLRCWSLCFFTLLWISVGFS